MLVVGAAVDLLPAQGTPKDEGGRVVLKDGQPNSVPAFMAEPFLDKAGELAAEALAVEAAVHHQQPDPGLAVCEVAVEEAKEPDELSRPIAGEQYLAAFGAGFLTQVGFDLIGPNILGVVLAGGTAVLRVARVEVDHFSDLLRREAEGR